MSADRRPPPPDRRCRATTKGQKDRGVYWSPPKRCGNYAGPDGYCPVHRPIDRPADDSGDSPAGTP